MQWFPQIVRDGMAVSGATATCLPVQIDSDQGDNDGWETAVFFQVGGTQSKEDRRILRKQQGNIALGLETDLVAHERAAVIVLRLIARTQPDDPLIGEVLLTPGTGGTHFQTAQLLTMQSRLVWFFGDKAGQVIRTQQMPFAAEHHAHFEELLSDATSHDAMIRMTSTYDAQAAISEIVSHYELRAATDRSEYSANQSHETKPRT